VFALIASTVWQIAACEVANTELKDDLKDVTRTALPLAGERRHFLQREFLWAGQGARFASLDSRRRLSPHNLFVFYFFSSLGFFFPSADCVTWDAVPAHQLARAPWTKASEAACARSRTLRWAMTFVTLSLRYAGPRIGVGSEFLRAPAERCPQVP
jgi:hypothetical protein